MRNYGKTLSGLKTFIVGDPDGGVSPPGGGLHRRPVAAVHIKTPVLEVGRLHLEGVWGNWFPH